MSAQYPGEDRLSSLFQPGKIGKLATKNRVKYGACCVSNYNNRDGSITPRELARSKIITETGCGIITNQGASPDPIGEGKAYYRQLGLYDDKLIPEYEQIAGWIHDSGAVAIQQLLHGGRYGGIELGYCVQPSVVPQTLPHWRPPREMTKEEIRQCIQDHADASRRAIKAGFDGIEITSFMGYLLANFNSKFTNRRTDEYGGSVANRARFMREMIYEVKNAIGDDHPFVVRLPGNELMDRYSGNTEDESFELIRIAAEAGVDMISITVGWQESPISTLARDVDPGHWNYLAARAKRENPNVQIAFGVRLPHADMADQCIASGELDFWEVCRPFLADPRRLHKVRADRPKEIKPCIGCVLCIARLFRDLPYLCTVNPALGHEVEPEYHVTEATKKKKIVVIGAGPAGLECAVTAAQRGHMVELHDSGDKIGGQLRLHAEHDLAIKEDLFQLLTYYDSHLKKHGVEVHLNSTLTADDLDKRGPFAVDAVVVAAGSRIARSEAVPGIEKAATALDLLAGRVQPGQKVVVIGGGKIGLATAEYLRSKEHEVTIVEEGKRIAEDVIPTWKWRHMSWVEEMGINVLARARVKEISDGAVTVLDRDGQEVTLAADTVILANKRVSNDELATALEFVVDEMHVIGDASVPRGLYQSIHSGYQLGCRI